MNGLLSLGWKMNKAHYLLENYMQLVLAKFGVDQWQIAWQTEYSVH